MERGPGSPRPSSHLQTPTGGTPLSHEGSIVMSWEDLQRWRRAQFPDPCLPPRPLLHTISTPPLYPYTPAYEAELGGVISVGERRATRKHVRDLCRLLRQLPTLPPETHRDQWFWHIGCGFSGFTWPLRFLPQILRLPAGVHTFIVLCEREVGVAAQVSVGDVAGRSVTIIRCHTTQGCDAAAVVNEVNARAVIITGVPPPRPAMLLLETDCGRGASARSPTASAATRAQESEYGQCVGLIHAPPLPPLHRSVGRRDQEG